MTSVFFPHCFENVMAATSFSGNNRKYQLENNSGMFMFALKASSQVGNKSLELHEEKIGVGTGHQRGGGLL